MSDMDLAMDVARRNPGALNICGGLLRSGRRDVLEKLHELDIVGSKVWIVFKDLGDQTLPTFVANVNSADLVQRLAALGYA